VSLSRIASIVLASKSMLTLIGSGMPASVMGGSANRIVLRSVLSVQIVS
jgi:hypothetical protein